MTLKTEVVSIEELLNTIQNQEQKLRENDREIKYLQEKLDYLIRQQFSSKSEKIGSNQPSLFDDNEEKIEIVEDEEIKIEITRKKGGRRKPAADLPRVRVEHDIDESDKIGSCGCKLHRIKEIKSAQYDIVPARFQVIENVRFVYGCRCGEKPKTTALTPFILPRTQVTASFLATIAVQKWCRERSEEMPLG
jgi:hypothetical protein